MVNWITFIPFIGVVSYLIILIFQFDAWKKTRMGRLFAIYLFILSVYSFSSWMMHRGVNPSPLFWFQIELAAIVLTIPIAPHIAWEFSRFKKAFSWLVWLLYFLAASLLFLLITGKLVKEVKLIPDAGGITDIKFYGTEILLWIATSVSLISGLLIYLVSYFRERDERIKSLLRYPLAGTLIINIGGFLNVVPTLRGYPVDLIGSFAYSILVAYAILRHQLLSPGAIFRKSSVYIFIALGFNAIFVFVLYKVVPLIDQIAGWQLWLLFSPFALFVFFLTTPLRQRFQNWLDRIFFGGQYNFRLTIEDFSKKAAANLNFDELTKSLVATLNRVFNCPVALFVAETKEESLHLIETAGFPVKPYEHSFVLIKSPIVEHLIKTARPVPVYSIKSFAGPAGILESGLKWLDNLDSELVCPMMFKDRLSGILVLGKKKGLYPYSDEDISLLSALGPQIAIALENARLYLESQEAYRELREAQEHLMHSERMKLLGEVSSGVAHDLNNLLAVISARAEMNLELDEQPQARRNTELIFKAAEDSAKVVKRLREFVKKPGQILQDKLDIYRVISDLQPMIEHRRSEMEQTRGVFYEVDYKLKASNEIMGNSSELRQAMVNIIFNAFDAMPNGGRIEVESQDKDEWAVISLRDTGMGMTQEVKEKIFQAFFTTKGDKGSGLGLSIAQGIVNKHGGKLTFDSEIGKGTIFYLTFPAANHIAGKRTGEIKQVSVPVNKRKILVIEDNKELGESITFFLNQAGYNAILATEGTDGLSKFQQDTFNMVVTDWGLSPMTGGDVALSIKAMNSKVPIMVITGWELNLSPIVLREMGIVDVVIKPFPHEEFLGRVARIIALS